MLVPFVVCECTLFKTNATPHTQNTRMHTFIRDVGLIFLVYETCFIPSFTSISSFALHRRTNATSMRTIVNTGDNYSRKKCSIRIRFFVRLLVRCALSLDILSVCFGNLPTIYKYECVRVNEWKWISNWQAWSTHEIVNSVVNDKWCKIKRIIWK